jgi:uncharacterized phage protein (TIGR02218 family)
MLVADLFTITLKKGNVLRYTSADQDISFGGNTFLSRDAQVERGTIQIAIGSSVDTLGLRITAKSTNLVAGKAIIQSIDQREWKGANVQVQTVYMPTFNDTSKGAELKFVGYIADVPVVTGLYVEIIVNSYFALLDATLPNKVIQPACPFTVYDTACGLARGSFAEAHTVQAGCTTNKVLLNSSSQLDGAYNMGYMEFTSGALGGLKFSIKQYTQSGGIYTPYVPLPVAPSAGDNCTIFLGCDHLSTTCNTKFANLARYGGFEFVPSPETAL